MFSLSVSGTSLRWKLHAFSLTFTSTRHPGADFLCTNHPVPDYLMPGKIDCNPTCSSNNEAIVFCDNKGSNN